MYKVFLFLVGLFLFVSAQTADIATQKLQNYVGYVDTVLLWVTGAANVTSTHLFNLTDFNHTRLIAKADDTVSTAFSSDSIKIAWGYQTGSIVLNSSGSRDTVWDESDKICVDTLSSWNYAPVNGVMDSAGSITQHWGAADTTCVTGYAIQSRSFAPHWNELLRIWTDGVTGNRSTTAVKFCVDIKRRLWDNVKIKY